MAHRKKPTQSGRDLAKYNREHAKEKRRQRLQIQKRGRGQNLPPSASEGKGKGPPSNPVGSKPDHKSAEKRYSPGDLSKKPNKAYYSPSLGRYVTGAGIKAQAAEDRKKMLKDKERGETQKKLEKSYDQGVASEKKRKADAEQKKKAAREKAVGDYAKKTRNSPAARSGVFSDSERYDLAQKHKKWKADRAAGKLKRRKWDPRKGKNQRR